MGDFLLVTLIWCFALFLLVSALLWTMGYRFRREQNAYLYYPDEPSESRRECSMPEDAGLTNAETVSIETSDRITLRGFMLWPCQVPHPNGSGAGSISSCAADTQSQAKRLGSPTSSSGGFAAGRPAFNGKAVTPIGSTNGSLTGGREAGLTATGSHGMNAQPAFVLIYFHGNAGNVGHRLPIAAAFAEKLHCAVLMMDYRGFGLSDDAEVDQEGLERDAQACLDYVVRDRRLPREHIYVMGTSLGGAVTIHLASKPHNARHIAAAIVENTFTSISDMVTTIGTQVITRAAPCPSVMLCLFLYYFKPLVLRIGWRSVREVPSIVVPMLFLSGKKDELVPPSQMKKLYAVACKSGSKRTRKLVEFADGMHNNLPTMPGYLDAIQQFINEVEQQRIIDVV